MRTGVRQVLGIVAIMAIALHTALWGVAPVHVSASAVDPFSVICHSGTEAGDTAKEIPANPASTPSRPCDHCNSVERQLRPLFPLPSLDFSCSRLGYCASSRQHLRNADSKSPRKGPEALRPSLDEFAARQARQTQPSMRLETSMFRNRGLWPCGWRHRRVIIIYACPRNRRQPVLSGHACDRRSRRQSLVALPTISMSKTGDDPSFKQLDISGEFAKRITEDFAIPVAPTCSQLYRRTDPP